MLIVDSAESIIQKRKSEPSSADQMSDIYDPRQDEYIQFWPQGLSVCWGKWGRGVGIWEAGGWKVAGRC